MCVCVDTAYTHEDVGRGLWQDGTAGRDHHVPYSGHAGTPQVHNSTLFHFTFNFFFFFFFRDFLLQQQEVRTKELEDEKLVKQTKEEEEKVVACWKWTP